MKLTNVTLAALLATAAATMGHTVSVNNFPGGGADLVSPRPVANDGTPIAPFLAVGSFSVDPAGLGADFATLKSSFTAFDSVGSAAGAAAGLFDLSGQSALSGSIPSDAVQGTDPFFGQTIYVVMGNGSDLAGSDQLAVWDAGLTFTKEDDLGNGADSVVISTTSGGTLDIGGTVEVDYGGGFAFANGIELVGQIPEPSTSLLAGFAGLALLIRRKR